MIEAAENVLRDLGFYDLRVRHHELRSEFRFSNSIQAGKPAGTGVQIPKTETVLNLARIEVGPGEMKKFLAEGVSSKIADALKQIGYAHVTLDLQGYRRGSLNETRAATATAQLAGKGN